MNRIRYERTKLKLSQQRLAQKLGVAQTTLSGWENNYFQPDFDSLRKLSEIFGVSIDYLLERTDIPTPVGSGITFSNVFPVEKKKIPFLGKIACGEPIFADEEKGVYMDTLNDLHVDFCLQAKGDSMINARIMDGDIVFIRSQPEVNNGEIAAVAIGDTATLKRVYYYPEKNQIILQAENPAYPPLTYTGAELEEIRILGKAVASQTNL